MTTQAGERIPEWTLGDRLRKAREMTGLKQREFGKRIGVSHQTVTNAEKDHRAVRQITINAWALATGVPVEWLETGNAPQPDGPEGGSELPRLDSNQEPAGYPSAQVIALRSPAARAA